MLENGYLHLLKSHFRFEFDYLRSRQSRYDNWLFLNILT